MTPSLFIFALQTIFHCLLCIVFLLSFICLLFSLFGLYRINICAVKVTKNAYIQLVLTAELI